MHTSKPKMGYIPEILAIYCKQPVELIINEENIQAKPAFIVDNTNEKTKVTALEWAKRSGWNQPANPDPEIVVKKNEPMTGVKLCDLVVRDEGGRAYKVLTPDNHYVDMREDVLLETILKYGIAKGGILLGKYVWARVGSQGKLVLYKSELYNQLVETSKVRDIKTTIKAKDFEVGGIYCGKNNEPYIFLGFVDTIEFKQDRNEGTLDYKEIKHGELWESYIDISDPLKRLYDSLDRGYPIGDMGKKGSLVKKLAQFDIPDDIFKLNREVAINRWFKGKKTWEDQKTKQEHDRWYNTRADYHMSWFPASYVNDVIMRKSGEPCPAVPNEIADFVELYYHISLPRE